MTVLSGYRRIAASVAGGALAILAACAEPEPGSANPEAGFRARLGFDWTLVSLDTFEISPPPVGTPADSPGRDLVPGQRPTIRFSTEPPGAGGRSFCNRYGGPFELRGDSLRFIQIESSLVGCDGPDSLETRFFRALRATRRFELDSTRLVLIVEDGTRGTFVPSGSPAAGS